MALASDLNQSFEALFPTWTTVVAALVALLIILFFLTKFLYNPVKKMYEDRRKYIQNNIDAAERLKKEAMVGLDQVEREMRDSSASAAAVIAAAEKQVATLHQTKMAEVAAEAARMIKNAESEIEARWAQFEIESKQVIVDLSLQAAARIVEKNIDQKVSQKVVEEFLATKKRGN